MSLFNDVIMRLKRDYFRWHHSTVAAGILDTAPVQRGDLPFVLLSMVQKKDVLCYLVAVKSFTHFVNPTRVVIVCDPSIDDADRAIFTRHIPHVELRRADEFTAPQIPRGGAWERLYAITEYARENYVVQLDADTVTTQPIPEIAAAVRSGKGFVLGEAISTPLRSLEATRERAQPLVTPTAHIQTRSEALMATVGLPEHSLYVRGCAGFTGFPPSTTLRQDMIDFSTRMGAKLDKDWAKWGTEQVTSNFLVANAVGTSSLPYPKYGTPDEEPNNIAFYHFIGSMRFINGKYAARTREAIEMLKRPVTADRKVA